jgi:SAM-dependent methyltransferase
MNLLDLINRPPVPEPWSEGDNIPWNEPGFSDRMLREHLSQEHDAASRRFDKIDRQVTWMNDHVLSRRSTRILDLACGPGLYAARLAKLGHECMGIDFSPASIAYAEALAQRDGLRCTFVCEDIRNADYGSGYGMAMFIFGEFNVFKPAEARKILTKAHAALHPQGVLVLEPSTYDHIYKLGRTPASWYSSRDGLFSDKPHVAFEENFWHEDVRASTTRHFVVDAATGEVTRYAATYQAYTNEQLSALLRECGFEAMQFYSSLIGVPDETQRELMAIVARKARNREAVS